MSIYQDTINSMYAPDRTINDRVTQIEEAIKELRHDLSLVLDNLMQMQGSDGVVEPIETPIIHKTSGKYNSLPAAITMLSEIPFRHDLDEKEIMDYCRFSHRIYKAKLNRERKNGCIGRLPVQSQILAWLIMNRIVNESQIDIHGFIDGLFLMAECSPNAVNWKLRKNNAYALRWMDQALMTSRKSYPEFSF